MHCASTNDFFLASSFFSTLEPDQNKTPTFLACTQSLFVERGHFTSLLQKNVLNCHVFRLYLEAICVAFWPGLCPLRFWQVFVGRTHQIQNFIFSKENHNSAFLINTTKSSKHGSSMQSMMSLKMFNFKKQTNIKAKKLIEFWILSGKRFFFAKIFLGGGSCGNKTYIQFWINIWL